MAEAVAAGCEVVEYSPNQVKQAVAGVGGASKDQMERMVQTLLGIAHPIRPVDAADAVAIAPCHLPHAPMRGRRSEERRVGHDCVSPGRARGWPAHKKKKKKKKT